MCEGYSTGGDLYVGEEATKYVSHISEYLEYSGVPDSAKIFMLYVIYSYSAKAPNKVLVISDKGLFGYNSKDSWSLLRKSWSDFRFTKLSYDESEGISFDGKFSGICEKNLLDILAKIHDQLIFYYDTHMVFL
ncbi:MAG: hypothetical protein IJ192_09625 [Clostridia bacterium]|nr:hypothetical protein [Clostridia bacterium]